jgi:hypothetical protein
MSAKPYAECITCGISLTTPDDAARHRSETLAAASETGVDARSHGTRILNPTPEEIAKSRIRREVERAIERCMDDLDTLVHRGEFTDEQVREELGWFPDFSDAWDEYVTDGAA